MQSLNLAVGLLFFPRLLQRLQLLFGENQISWAALASKAFSRLRKVSRSCRSQIERTPPGETKTPCFLSSLETRS